MLTLGAAFVVYVVASLMYIRRLQNRLKGYEHVWNQIENIADRNEDGTFTLDVKHLEEASEPFDHVHDRVSESGLMMLNEDDGSRESEVPGPRAA